MGQSGFPTAPEGLRPHTPETNEIRLDPLRSKSRPGEDEARRSERHREIDRAVAKRVPMRRVQS